MRRDYAIEKVLLIGATSAIAHEVAKHFAREGASLCLVGRSEDKLESVAKDLRVRGAKAVSFIVQDLTMVDRHEAVLRQAVDYLEGLDAALIAHGQLPNQRAVENDPSAILRAFSVNCLSVLSLVTLIGEYFGAQNRGILAVISSVAGDRGRRSNYVYGAAKGAVDIFLDGLRVRFQQSGVTVLSIRPGLVDTPMTMAIKKNVLFATAHEVGEVIYHAMKARKSVVYAPGFWKWIMLVIKLLPRRIFHKLPL